MVYQLKVTLQGTRPKVWRRILVPTTTMLAQLHDTLQITMGWEDEHLHQFFIKDKRYAVPDPEDYYEVLDERKTVLGEVVPRAKTKFRYQYDFGDSWEHEILVEKIIPANPKLKYPLCVKGARACPPEDSGGVWGYAEKLRVLKKPKDPDYEDILEWMGDDFDPDHFDIAEVNMQLRRLKR